MNVPLKLYREYSFNSAFYKIVRRGEELRLCVTDELDKMTADM